MLGADDSELIQKNFDVFLSYAHADAQRVQPLVNALRRAGLKVWYDETDVRTFESITRGVVEGLANSKALLAFYSETYPTRRACQWELTAAFLAGQHEGQDPCRRVLVVNPEAGAAHIHPIELRDARFLPCPPSLGEHWYADIAEAVVVAVRSLPGPLSLVKRSPPPPWHGGKGLGSNRFVGRTAEFWRLHSALLANDNALISAQSAPGHAQVRGLAGIGKSLFAEEYALRFGAAYPGGIFLLRGSGNLHDQLVCFASRRQLSVQGLACDQVESLLEAELRSAALPYLWLVDDLPSGLEEAERRRWFAPNDWGKTLITTRSREYGSTGGCIDLDILGLQEGFELLTARRPPLAADEQRAAREIVVELGQHALALDVAGGALAKLKGRRDYRGFLADIRSSEADVLATAARLRPDLPNGHERSIAATFSRSIDLLDESGRDFLRLASLLATAVIPPVLFDVVCRSLGADDLYGAAAVASAVESHGLADNVSEEGGASGYLVHALVGRTMRFYDKDRERRETIRCMTLSLLCQMLPEVAAQVGSYRVLRDYAPHARHLIASSAPDDLAGAILALWVGRLDHERGDYSAARGALERAVKAASTCLGDEHSQTCLARTCLSLTLEALGELDEARCHLENVLEVTQRRFGADDARTLRAQHNLATVICAQGDLAGARWRQEEVLAAVRRTEGIGPELAVSALINLAATLKGQGNLSGARAHEEAALLAGTEALGAEHPQTLAARSNLAGTLRMQGELARARAHEEAVLRARTLGWGEEHPDTLVARSNLASTLHAQGECESAIEHQTAVAEQLRVVLGEDHPNTLRARSSLALMLRGRGDLAGARQLQQSALLGLIRRFGEEHFESLAARCALAETLAELGDGAAAQRQLQTLQESIRSMYGSDDPATVRARHRLSQQVFNLKDREGALLRQRGEVEAARLEHGDSSSDLDT